MSLEAHRPVHQFEGEILDGRLVFLVRLLPGQHAATSRGAAVSSRPATGQQHHCGCEWRPCVVFPISSSCPSDDCATVANPWPSDGGPGSKELSCARMTTIVEEHGMRMRWSGMTRPIGLTYHLHRGVGQRSLRPQRHSRDDSRLYPRFRIIWSTACPAMALQRCMTHGARPDVLVVDMALGRHHRRGHMRRYRRPLRRSAWCSSPPYDLDHRRDAVEARDLPRCARR